MVGGAAFVACAPAIVRAASIMPVKVFGPPFDDGTFCPVYKGFDYGELARITRKALLPRLFVQITDNNPLFRKLVLAQKIPVDNYASH